MDDPGRKNDHDDHDDDSIHTNATSSSAANHPDVGGDAQGGVGWRGAMQLAQDLKQQLGAARGALAAREAEVEASRAREQEWGAQEVGSLLCLVMSCG